MLIPTFAIKFLFFWNVKRKQEEEYTIELISGAILL